MDDFAAAFWLSALLTGLAFGYVIQRGGFCLTRAISNLALMGDAGSCGPMCWPCWSPWWACMSSTALGLVEVPVRPFPLARQYPGRAPLRRRHDSRRRVLGQHVVPRGRRRHRRLGDSSRIRPGRDHRECRRAGAAARLAAEPGARAASGGAPPPCRRRSACRPGWSSPCSAPGRCLALRGPREPEHGKWAWPAHGRGGGDPDRSGLVDVHARRAARRHHVRGEHRACLTYPLVGYPNQVTWSMVLLVGMPIGAFLGAWPAGDFRWKLPARLEPGEDLRRRPADGRLGAGRRRLQYHPGPHQLGHAQRGQPAAFVSMCAGGWLTLWALYLRKG